MRTIKVVLGVLVCTIILTGCGVRFTFRNDTKQVAVSTEAKEEFSTETTTEGVVEEIKKKNDTTEDVITTEAGVAADVDVFSEKYSFELPEGYALLDNESNSNTSKMYVLSKKGKIVATIFMDYPDTKGYKEGDINEAYKAEIESKYNVTLKYTVDANEFCWNGYYGDLKGEEEKVGYAMFDSSGGETVYIEFMSMASYDCSSDIATIIKSFKSKGVKPTEQTTEESK